MQMSKCHPEWEGGGLSGRAEVRTCAWSSRTSAGMGLDTGTPADRAGRGDHWASPRTALACHLMSLQGVETEMALPTALYFLLLS